MLAVSSSAAESACLFTAVPSSYEGSRLTDAAFLIATGIRLGVPVITPGRCPCGDEIDALGDHALVCKLGVGCAVRHMEINARHRDALRKAYCPFVI